jgi:ribosomal protein L37E
MKPNWRGRKAIEACLKHGGFVLGGKRIGEQIYCRRCDYSMSFHVEVQRQSTCVIGLGAVLLERGGHHVDVSK